MKVKKKLNLFPRNVLVEFKFLNFGPMKKREIYFFIPRSPTASRLTSNGSSQRLRNWSSSCVETKGSGTLALPDTVRNAYAEVVKNSPKQLGRSNKDAWTDFSRTCSAHPWHMLTHDAGCNHALTHKPNASPIDRREAHQERHRVRNAMQMSQQIGISHLESHENQSKCTSSARMDARGSARSPRRAGTGRANRRAFSLAR